MISEIGRKTYEEKENHWLYIPCFSCDYPGGLRLYERREADMKRYEAQGRENAERLYQRKVWSGCENQGSDLREI